MDRTQRLERETRILVEQPLADIPRGEVTVGSGGEQEREDPDVPTRNQFVEHVDEKALLAHFRRLRQAIAGTVAEMPGHAAYIERNVKAD